MFMIVDYNGVIYSFRVGFMFVIVFLKFKNKFSCSE